MICRELEEWAKTDVDALFIQDDWETQISLLISPELWREMFKPYPDREKIREKDNDAFGRVYSGYYTGSH